MKVFVIRIETYNGKVFHIWRPDLASAEQFCDDMVCGENMTGKNGHRWLFVVLEDGKIERIPVFTVQKTDIREAEKELIMV